MPLYRYECESCGNQFTVLVRQQAQGDVPMCPECGSKGTRRMVPRVAVQFKGSGYYKTDYARKGKGSLSSGKEANSSTQSAVASNPEKKSDDTSSGKTASTSTAKSAKASTNPPSSE